MTKPEMHGPLRRAALGTGAAIFSALALVGGVAVLSYPRWRTWCLTWGSAGDEATGTLPGDELLSAPDILSTRAVRVDATPDAIWPWLVQMGPGRGGVYTYDWIENFFGLGVHSVDEVLPEYQDIQVGFAQQLGTKGPVLRVAILEPTRAFVLRSDDGNWVWAFVLVPDGSATRLISRNRIATPGASPLARWFYKYAMEPGSLVMERKMLMGIKQRAERLKDGTGPTPSKGRPADPPTAS